MKKLIAALAGVVSFLLLSVAPASAQTVTYCEEFRYDPPLAEFVTWDVWPVLIVSMADGSTATFEAAPVGTLAGTDVVAIAKCYPEEEPSPTPTPTVPPSPTPTPSATPTPEVPTPTATATPMPSPTPTPSSPEPTPPAEPTPTVPAEPTPTPEQTPPPTSPTPPSELPRTGTTLDLAVLAVAVMVFGAMVWSIAPAFRNNKKGNR